MIALKVHKLRHVKHLVIPSGCFVKRIAVILGSAVFLDSQKGSFDSICVGVNAGLSSVYIAWISLHELFSVGLSRKTHISLDWARLLEKFSADHLPVRFLNHVVQISLSQLFNLNCLVAAAVLRRHTWQEVGIFEATFAGTTSLRHIKNRLAFHLSVHVDEAAFVQTGVFKFGAFTHVPPFSQEDLLRNCFEILLLSLHKLVNLLKQTVSFLFECGHFLL